MKPWHLVVLLLLIVGPVVGFVLRQRATRTQWLLVLLVGTVLLVGGAVGRVSPLSVFGCFAAGAGLLGAITTRARANQN